MLKMIKGSLINDHRLHVRQSPDYFVKLFDKRSCHISLPFSVWTKTYEFFHSVALTFNRHTLAIFFGNALPSFIVVLANVLSMKVIFFSNSVKYLQQTNSRAHRKSRFQTDIRAFIVILIESFSVIMISWGIPIFLTMRHCRTLYVESITVCPKIKNYLALFLYTDLFNSSTNCLLYSLSGKLFRAKFLSLIHMIFTCGRGKFWGKKQHSFQLANQQLIRQYSNSASTNTNFQQLHGVQSSRPNTPVLNGAKKTLSNGSNTKNLPSHRKDHRRIFRPQAGKTLCGAVRNSQVQNNSPRSSDEMQNERKTTSSNESTINLNCFENMKPFGSIKNSSASSSSLKKPLTVEISNNSRLVSTKISQSVGNPLTKQPIISLSTFTNTDPRRSEKERNSTNFVSNNLVDSVTIQKEIHHENLTSL